MVIRSILEERQPAIFIDKDGTLIHDAPFNVQPAKVRWREGAIDALRHWQKGGYRLVLITNQKGLALGRFALSDWQFLLTHLQSTLWSQGVCLDGIYYCPHDPTGVVPQYVRPCDCRKPREGLLCRAAAQLNIDLATSWMIGDILDDVEAGNRAGCRSILLDVGSETHWQTGLYRKPWATVRSFEEAVRLIPPPVPVTTRRGPPSSERLARSFTCLA